MFRPFSFPTVNTGDDPKRETRDRIGPSLWLTPRGLRACVNFAADTFGRRRIAPAATRLPPRASRSSFHGATPTSALLNKANADREREGAENQPSDDPLSARPRLSFPRPIAPAHRARGVTVQPVTQRRRARAWARDSNRTRAPVKAAIALPFCHQYLRSSDMLPPRLPAPRRRTPRRPEREGWVTLPKERRRSSPRGRPLPPSTRSRQRVSPVPTSWPQRLPHVCLVRHTPSESNGPLGQPTHPARPHRPHRSPAHRHPAYMS